MYLIDAAFLMPVEISLFMYDMMNMNPYQFAMNQVQCIQQFLVSYRCKGKLSCINYAISLVNSADRHIFAYYPYDLIP